MNINLNSFAKMNIQKSNSQVGSNNLLNSISAFGKDSVNNTNFESLDQKIEETINVMSEHGEGSTVFSSQNDNSHPIKDEKIESYQAEFDKLADNISSKQGYGVF